MISALAAVCLLLWGNTGNPFPKGGLEEPAAREGFPLTVTNYDGNGYQIDTTYQRPPERIIALWQNSVETLLELGAGDRIIAAGGIDQPGHLKESNQKLYEKIPVVLRHTISQETAAMLRPDFILGWRFDFTGKANSIGTWDFWNSRGVPIYMTNTDGADYRAVHTVEDELQYIMDIGAIVGHRGRAEAIVSDIRERMRKAEAQADRTQPPQRVAVVFYMDQTIHIYTPRTLPGDIVQRLGGQIIGADEEQIGKDETISYEKLLLEDPDILFIQSAPEFDEARLAAVYDNPKLKNLSCVQKKRVYTIPFYTIRDPAVRVGEAVDRIAEGMYP